MTDGKQITELLIDWSRGDTDALDKLMPLVEAELKKISEEKYVSTYYFALASASLGDKTKAFEWLEKAFAAREGRITLMKADPLLNDLHSDPRFENSLKRVGLEK